MSQTGQPEDRFADVVVKELLDNALAAARSPGARLSSTARTSQVRCSRGQLSTAAGAAQPRRRGQGAARGKGLS